MKKQKKQSLLSNLIGILVIALIMMLASIVYEEKANMDNQQSQNTVQQKDEASEKQPSAKEEKEELQDEETVKNEKENNEEQEFVGEEENNKEDSTLNKDEKVIQLVKKEWGEDESVTFSIVDKSTSKYRVSVISSSTAVLQWYEVDTETWEVSEF